MTLFSKVEDEKNYYRPTDGIVRMRHENWWLEDLKNLETDTGGNLIDGLTDWVLKDRFYPFLNSGIGS